MALVPERPLSPARTVRLPVNGSLGGPTNQAGILLDGDGQPGGSSVATLRGRTVTGPTGRALA